MRERALVRNGRRDISSYYTPAVFRRLILICSLFLSLFLDNFLYFSRKKNLQPYLYFFFFPSGGNKYSHVDHRHHLDGSICLVRDDTALFFSLSPPSLEEFEKQLCYKNESIYSRCWIIIALARHNLHIMVPNKASWHKHPLLEKEEKKNGSCCSNCSLKSVRPHCFLYIYIYILGNTL